MTTKFTTGQRVRVIGNHSENVDHYLVVGTIATVLKSESNDVGYPNATTYFVLGRTRTGELEQYVSSADLEPVEPFEVVAVVEVES